MAGMTCAAKRLKPAAREPTHYAPATDRKEGIRRGISLILQTVLS